MNRWFDIRNKKLIAVLATVLLSACSAIDDDLSDCGVDYELQYELQLVTNMELELETQLTTQVETSVAAALREHLKDIFSDFAHDIDLSFYDVDEQLGRLSHEQHVMNDNEKSYTLYLPMREYRHLALANLQQNTWVTLTGEEHSNTMMLQQVQNEPVQSHQTGIFAARTNMDVLENQSQTFHVNLYMVNCAAVLLLESRGHDAKDVSVVSTGSPLATMWMKTPTHTRTILLWCMPTEWAWMSLQCCVIAPSPSHRLRHLILHSPHLLAKRYIGSSESM